MRYVIREVIGTRRVQYSVHFGYFLVPANEEEHIFNNKDYATFVCEILRQRTGTRLNVFEVGAELV